MKTHRTTIQLAVGSILVPVYVNFTKEGTDITVRAAFILRGTDDANDNPEAPQWLMEAIQQDVNYGGKTRDILFAEATRSER